MKKTKEFIEPTIKTYSSLEFDLEIFKFSTYQYEEKHNLRPLQNSLFKICSFHHIFVPL